MDLKKKKVENKSHKAFIYNCPLPQVSTGSNQSQLAQRSHLLSSEYRRKPDEAFTSLQGQGRAGLPCAQDVVVWWAIFIEKLQVLWDPELLALGSSWAGKDAFPSGTPADILQGPGLPVCWQVPLATGRGSPQA